MTAGNILIIDDEASLRQTFAQILRRAGYEVLTAPNGLEALKRLASGNKYDLAYLDIHLPDMDGVEVLKQIHELYPLLPVIMFTGHASLQTAMQAIRFGATDYLSKPIDPEELINRTRAVLAQQATNRRRREIQEQIAALQNELQTLEETANTPPAPPLPPGNSAERFLTLGRLNLDMQMRRATFDDVPLILPPATFDYLAVLARHSPDVVTYQTLVSEAQGYSTDRHEAQELAKWHVHELRHILEPNRRRPTYILNVRGSGYRLIMD